MSRNKRLFLFAGYDKNGIIDDALIYYISALYKLGDIIVCIDCDCKKSETDKIKPYTIHTITNRHGEYDFGSYKRAYQYARDKNILQNYDYVYLVNDSVFGPMFDMKEIITKIEQLKTDAASIVISKHKTHEFMESWFVRLNKKIFMSDWFNKFLSSVKQESEKSTITIKYEHGLTNTIKNNKCSYSGVYDVYGRKTYNKPKTLFNQGCPFVKKLSFIRHNGALGVQIKYILKHGDKNAIESVITTANRLYGKDYMKKFLTYNPIKILYRNITYGLKKLKSGEI